MQWSRYMQASGGHAVVQIHAGQWWPRSGTGTCRPVMAMQWSRYMQARVGIQFRAIFVKMAHTCHQNENQLKYALSLTFISSICRCVRGILDNKLVVLVTHQIQYALQADKILLIKDVSKAYKGEEGCRGAKEYLFPRVFVHPGNEYSFLP